MEQIPLIDLSLSMEENASMVHDALRDVGFLYIENHGISEELQTKLSDVSKDFFGQDQSIKDEIAMRKGGKAWRGYFPFKGELTSGIPDLKEGIYYGVEHDFTHHEVVRGTPLHGPNQWSSERMQEIVSDYMDNMNRLGETMMRLTALGLGVEPTYFSDRYGDEPTCLFRIFNYPFQEIPLPEAKWGVHEHTDMGFLTILLQDENGGLEVKSRGSDEWISAPPIPGTFVVNIGDMLELWTHGIYQATLHRVKNNSGNDRLSFPFFFDPSWNTKLNPIQTNLLRSDELATVPKATVRKWDKADLHTMSEDLTYGDFVWEKVSRVFPLL